MNAIGRFDRQVSPATIRGCQYLGMHVLVSKIKPRTSKFKHLNG